MTWEIVKERNVPVVARNFILHMQVGLIKEQKQEKAQSIIAAGVVLEKMNRKWGIVMRLIDADRLIKLLKEQKVKETGAYTKGINSGLNVAKCIINDNTVQSPVVNDVCECRLLKGYNFLHKTSCGDVFEMENGFKFCPYCGKKIKIVGG